MTAVRTRFAYIAYVGNETVALDFEQQALTVARDLLPAVAIEALDRNGNSPEYWSWLAGQWDSARAETDVAIERAATRRP